MLPFDINQYDANGMEINRSQTFASENPILPKGVVQDMYGNYLQGPYTEQMQMKNAQLPTTPPQLKNQSPASLDTPASISNQRNYEFNDKIPAYGALLNSIGPASQLAGTLINGVDDVNFARLDPKHVNFDPAMDIARRQGANAMAVNRMNVNNNARNSGQALSNLVAGNVGINSNLQNQLAMLKQQELNTNNQIDNNANQINTQIANEEQIARQQNKAAYRQAIYGALSDMGNIGAGYTRDNAMLKAQNTQNQRALDMMSSLPYRYDWFIDENGNLKTGVKQ